MTENLMDGRPAEPTYGVLFDRPDHDRMYAYGPFAGFDAAARFAEFVQAEIDPARVIPWLEAQALPGVRVLDAVTELLNWRTSVALPHAADSDRLRAELAAQRELASLATVLEIPRENAAPLQVRQIYDDTDRWAICDRTGRRWYRAEEGVAAGWFYEPEREALCDLGRFTLAEALPIARQLAAAPSS